MERDMSPLVTAVANSAMARTWLERLEAKRLTFLFTSFHVHDAPGTLACLFFFSSRRRHTSWPRDWSSDVCSSILLGNLEDAAKTVAKAVEQAANASPAVKAQ